MPIDINKHEKKETTKLPIADKIDENMRDYSNEPFFLKKTASAIATLTKYGLPKEWEDRIKKTND